jgi:hypothetical protein
VETLGGERVPFGVGDFGDGDIFLEARGKLFEPCPGVDFVEVGMGAQREVLRRTRLCRHRIEINWRGKVCQWNGVRELTVKSRKLKVKRRLARSVVATGRLFLFDGKESG